MLVEKIIQRRFAEKVHEGLGAAICFGPKHGDRVIENPAHPGPLDSLSGEDVGELVGRGGIFGANKRRMFPAVENSPQGAEQFVAVSHHGQGTMPAGGSRPEQHVGDLLRCHLRMVGDVREQGRRLVVQQIAGVRRHSARGCYRPAGGRSRAFTCLLRRIPRAFGDDCDVRVDALPSAERRRRRRSGHRLSDSQGCSFAARRRPVESQSTVLVGLSAVQGSSHVAADQHGQQQLGPGPRSRPGIAARRRSPGRWT